MRDVIIIPTENAENISHKKNMVSVYCRLKLTAHNVVDVVLPNRFRCVVTVSFKRLAVASLRSVNRRGRTQGLVCIREISLRLSN